MSDSDSTYPPQRSSLILFFATAALSLIPDDVLRYSSLGVVLTSLGIYAAHRKRPLARLDALNDRIKAATDILARARFMDTPSALRRLTKYFRVKLFASMIHSDLLEAQDTPWKLYAQMLKGIWQTLNQCERRVRKIQTLALLAIESENRRKLAYDMTDSLSRDITNALVRSPEQTDFPIQTVQAPNESRALELLGDVQVSAE
ncbi:hypothetical protein B0H13DRAFT_1924991 [Mycena leptocephala]|nr:hypothetical protein B0H13DRAFT_1924991 [Mycena leptocephala]